MEDADDRRGGVPGARSGRRGGLLVVYPAYYAFLGVVTPYFPLWLQVRGLDVASIARVTALVMIATTLGQLLLPSTAVRVGLRHLAIAVAGAALVFTSALAGVHSGPAILAIAGISGLFCGALLPIADALVLAGQGGGWGGMRAWGSLGFAVATLTAGWAIELWGTWTVVAAEALALALVLLGIVSTRSHAAILSSAVERVSGGEIAALLRRADLWLLVIAVATINAGHAYYYTFANLHWAVAYRFGAATSGLLWAVGVVAEIAVLALSSRIFGKADRDRRAVQLLLVGAAAGVLRWSVTALDPPLAVLLLLQTLHGLTFGATLLGGMEALRAMVPPRLLAPALGLFAAMVHGVVIGSVTFLLGGRFGPQGQAGFVLMALVAAAGFAVTLVFAVAGQRLRIGRDRLST
ncbi:MFS transporter [Novosphingobium sp. P6W]|uniref:MFS transporter n=1 Tax=Novosphingobium sp. P6W TaxID=1609758 RepID=UPI0013B43B7E|nr:MFS transporter [Novosphingobium sp. P6W]